MNFQLGAACREARTLSFLLFGPTPIGATYFTGNFGYSVKRFSTSVSRMPLKGFKNKLQISSFLYCLTQARTRRVRSTFSSRWLTSATSIILPLKFFFSNAKNRTWGCWVGCKYATCVLCSTPAKPFFVLFFQPGYESYSIRAPASSRGRVRSVFDGFRNFGNEASKLSSTF